jgi:hypothetical protein
LLKLRIQVILKNSDAFAFESKSRAKKVLKKLALANAKSKASQTIIFKKSKRK